MSASTANLEETTTPIRKVPPELFSLIASHLPLQHLPPTLSTLALTCRPIYSYVQPVLYAKVVIKDQDHATQLLERISSDPQLGHLIREFHLFINIHVEAHKRHSSLLYRRLVLLKFRYPEVGDDPDFDNQYFLPQSFWETLRRRCPLLQQLCGDGVEYSLQDTWRKDPDFYDLKDFLGLSKEIFGLLAAVSTLNHTGRKRRATRTK